MPNIVIKGFIALRKIITKGYGIRISKFVKFCDVYDTANICQIIEDTAIVSIVTDTES